MEPLFDKALVRRRFSKAAKSYDKASFLQKEVGKRLLEHLEGMVLEPRAMADLGSGTGEFTRALLQRFPKAHVLGMDFSLAMCHQAQRKSRPWKKNPFFVAADAEALPLFPQSLELLASNLMLQWVDEPMAVFSQARQALRPRGLFLFSTFGPDTLKEIRGAFSEDVPHTSFFWDMHDLGDMLSASGFSSPVLDREDLRVCYPDPRSLFLELKTLGATCAHRARRSTLMGKGRWQKAMAHLCAQGDFFATWEVIYAHAWAPGK